MALTRITKGVIKPNENYDTHNINSTGIVTAIGLDVNGNGDISGNLNVGGVLTYEDVTSIDSVGVITARVGIDCNGDIDVDGHTNLDNVSVAGVTTFASNVNLGDNDKIIFGSGNRFSIYDNGTSAIIDNTYGSGSILRLGSGNQVVLGSPLSNNQTLIRGVVNGPSELYHAGAKKLETYTSGINVTGNTVADGLTIDGDSDLNGDLDVDGHTNLDNVSIAGVTTFSDSDIFFKNSGITSCKFDSNIGQFYFNNTGGLTWYKNGNLSNSSGATIYYSEGAVPNGYGGLIIQAPWQGQSNAKNIKVMGSSNGYFSIQSNLNASENFRATFQGGVNLGYYQSGTKLSTTTTGVSLPKDLDVDGHTNLDNVSIAGVTTTTGNVNVGVDLDVTDDITLGGEFNMLGSSDNNKYFDARIGSSYKLIFRSSSGGAGNLVTMLQLGTTGSSLVGNFALGDSSDSSSAAGPEFTLNRNSSSPANADYLGQIKFAGRSSTGVQRNYAKITGKILDVTNGLEDGILEFSHIRNGSQAITGRWRSDSLQLLNDTNLSVAGDTTLTGDLDVDGHTNLDNVSIAGITTITGDFKVTGAGNGRVEIETQTARAVIRASSGLGIYGETGQNNNANLSLHPTGNAVYANLFFYNTAGNSYASIIGHAGGTLFFTGGSNSPLRHRVSGSGFHSFQEGNTERLRITAGGDVLTSGNTQLFGSNTNDGSDNKAIMINGGGAVSDTRGGYLLVHGNEHSSFPGVTRLHAGNVGTAYIAFNTAGSERLRITSGGDVSIGGRDEALSNYAAGSTTTKLAVVEQSGGSGYSEVAHFTAGTDSNDTGAIVRITQFNNDRGLFIKAGRGTSDQAKAIIGLRNSSAVDGNWITLTQNTDQITCHKSVDIDNGVNLSLGGTSGTHAPLHVKSENTSYGKNAVFGAKGWVNNANYHYTDATISLLGRDNDDNDKGVGIEFSARNTANTNWLHGALTMGQDGHIRLFGGGAGTYQGTEKLRIASDGVATFAATNINVNRNAGDAFISLQTSGTSNVSLYGGASSGFRVFTKPSGGSLTERLSITSDGAFYIKSPSNSNGLQPGELQWWNENGYGVMAKIAVNREGSSGAPSGLKFYTSANVDTSANNSQGDITERLHIDSAGKFYKEGNQFYPLINYYEANLTGSVDNSQTGSFSDVKTILSGYQPKKVGSRLVVHHAIQTWNGAATTGSSDAYGRIVAANGSGWQQVWINMRLLGNFQFDERYTHRTEHAMFSFVTAATSIDMKFQAYNAHSSTTINYYHTGEQNLIQIYEYDIT